MTSLWLLEKCKPCLGTGRLGFAAVALVCENCDGSGMVWAEKGWMTDREGNDE